jgi:hypothetical protein
MAAQPESPEWTQKERELREREVRSQQHQSWAQSIGAIVAAIATAAAAFAAWQAGQAVAVSRDSMTRQIQRGQAVGRARGAWRRQARTTNCGPDITAAQCHGTNPSGPLRRRGCGPPGRARPVRHVHDHRAELSSVGRGLHLDGPASRWARDMGSPSCPRRPPMWQTSCASC